jgi:hypothetical protein
VAKLIFGFKQQRTSGNCVRERGLQVVGGRLVLNLDPGGEVAENIRSVRREGHGTASIRCGKRNNRANAMPSI